jgi:thymidylate synthase
MKNNVDEQYLQLVKHILKNGVKKSDRTGTGTLSVFDYSMRFDMSEGFPLLTSKKMFTKGVIHELIWFLRGDTNIKYLVDNDVHIWDGDAYKRFLTDAASIKEGYLSGDILGSQPHIDEMFSNPDELIILTKEEFIEKIKTDDEFAKKWGNLGPVYGKQWISWSKFNDRSARVTKQIRETPKDGGFPQTRNINWIEGGEVVYIDQIANLINDLKTNPDSRRLMVSAWNVGEIDNMVLPPCHYGFQCYTQEMNLFERKKWWCESLEKSIHYAEDFNEKELDTLNVPKRKLSLKWNQRSVDVGLGLGFNIASYALLLHLLAKEVNMIPNELIFSGGDCHIYLNHVEKLKEQLQNETFELPKLELTNTSFDDIKYEDIKIINYKSSGVIKMNLSN